MKGVRAAGRMLWKQVMKGVSSSFGRLSRVRRSEDRSLYRAEGVCVLRGDGIAGVRLV